MPAEQAQARQKPTAAFILSLLAGLSMLGTGWMVSAMGAGGPPGWMWSPGMMRGFPPALWWPWFGLVAGLVVLIGAVILYSNPAQARTWGIVILIASGLNFLIGMGGFVSGTLGIIGGALALSWRPPR